MEAVGSMCVVREMTNLESMLDSAVHLKSFSSYRFLGHDTNLLEEEMSLFLLYLF